MAGATRRVLRNEEGSHFLNISLHMELFTKLHFFS